MTKAHWFIVFACLICWLPGQEIWAGKINSDSLFARARQLARQGDRAGARALCQQILEVKPHYHEVRVYLARVYAWDKLYQPARKHLHRVLQERPDYREALSALADLEMWSDRYQEGLHVVNQALRYYPTDDEFLIKKARFLIKLDRRKEAARFLMYVLERHPSHPEALKWLNAIRSSAPMNKLALYYIGDFFDRGARTYGPWHQVSAEFSRRLPLGSVFFRANFASRKFGASAPREGFQYEMDAYPKIARGKYLYLNAGYSSHTIFPRYRLGGEMYLSIGKGFELSAGIRYLQFRASSVAIYTGTIGKYYKNFWFSLRPFITPKNVGTSFSMQFLWRWYFGHADNYLTFSTGFGSSPAEVETQEELRRLDSQKLGINWQQLLSRTTLVKFGLSFENEEFRLGEFGKRYTLRVSFHQRF